MSVFKGNRHNQAWMEPGTTVADGVHEDNPHSLANQVSGNDEPPSYGATAGYSSSSITNPNIKPVPNHWSNEAATAEQEDIRNAPLVPFPSPGFAVFPNLLPINQKSGSEMLLMMKPNWKNKGFDVLDISAESEPSPMFTIENPSPNLKPSSSKRVFSDANTGGKLCKFEKETKVGTTTYKATDPDGKAPLVEVKVDKQSKAITASATVLAANAVFPDQNSSLMYSNEIDDGSRKRGSSAAGKPTLEYNGHATELRGMIECQGQLVATIEKRFLVTSTEYHLRIAQGLDPFLVVVLAVAVDDRRNTRASLMPFGGVGGSLGIA